MQRIKRILLVRTGGTIESVSNPGERIAPSRHGTIDGDFLEGIRAKYKVDVLTDMPLRNHRDKPTLKDSSEMGLKDWVSIARSIGKHVVEDGIHAAIVTHGTDTLAYTASALTFMLGNLGLPVIVTGSETVWDRPESDGPRNLLNSFSAVMQLGPGVFVVFGSKILLGCRTVKVHTASPMGFGSINYPELGEISGDNDIRLFIDNGKPLVFDRGLVVFDRFADPIFVTAPVPDLSPDILYGVKASGILISAYGPGNLPEAWRKATEELSRTMPLAITTQCINGSVRPQVYEVGAPATVIPCGDMAFPCAAVKFRWAIGKGEGDRARVRELMTTNFHGEINLQRAA